MLLLLLCGHGTSIVCGRQITVAVGVVDFIGANGLQNNPLLFFEPGPAMSSEAPSGWRGDVQANVLYIVEATAIARVEMAMHLKGKWKST